MSTPFLGEIKMFAFGFAPRGWAFCNGQILSIQQNAALFSLLGTTYGGNGQTNFALPNLQGRAPAHIGNSIVLGQQAGSPTVTLNATQIPQHTHTVLAASGAANNANPINNRFAKTTDGTQLYQSGGNYTQVASTFPNVGGSQPHNNMQPYLVLQFSIALQGIFPSRN
jgi:microcystin-dependent protein